MKKKTIIIPICLLIMPLAYYFFFLRDQRDNRLMREGDELVKKIEGYKSTFGKLPNSLQDIGITQKEEDSLYYDKKDSIKYIIWYGTSLGESKTYYSDSRKWEDYDR